MVIFCIYAFVSFIAVMPLLRNIYIFAQKEKRIVVGGQEVLKKCGVATLFTFFALLVTLQTAVE